MSLLSLSLHCPLTLDHDVWVTLCLCLNNIVLSR
jgi:hypothetical protein